MGQAHKTESRLLQRRLDGPKFSQSYLFKSWKIPSEKFPHQRRFWYPHMHVKMWKIFFCHELKTTINSFSFFVSTLFFHTLNSCRATNIENNNWDFYVEIQFGAFVLLSRHTILPTYLPSFCCKVTAVSAKITLICCNTDTHVYLNELGLYCRCAI